MFHLNTLTYKYADMYNTALILYFQESRNMFSSLLKIFVILLVNTKAE